MGEKSSRAAICKAGRSVSADARAYLARMSEDARAQLTALIALVNEARPFSAAMQSAKVMAEMAAASGQKPN